MALPAATMTKRDFWILVGSLWVVGLLGIIMSTTAINNAKKLKKISETQETKTGFLVFMLIVFIVILIGTSVYGFISRSGSFKGFMG